MRHQVTRQLMRWFNVLFVELLTGAQGNGPANVARRENNRLIIYRPELRFRIPKRIYANIPWVHATVNACYCRAVVDTVRQQKDDSQPALLFNFVYHFPEIMKADVFLYRTYICFDELPKMWRRASKPNTFKMLYQAKLYQMYENQAARLADRCLASHTPLVRKLSRVNPRTVLFLHGHEFCESPIVQVRRSSKSPIRVGFMGYITYNLLLDWLWAILNEPTMELYLIGPIGRFVPAPFQARPNFYQVPPLVGADLLEKLVEMDVLIMPYDASIPEVNVLTVPNKFFQYVAAGRPVVISDLPNSIDMPKGVTYRARTAREFVDKIVQAHGEDCDEFVQLRLKIAAENTWDKRGDMLLSIIRQDMGSRLPNL